MEGVKRIIELPEIVPVLPVRNTVLFPNAAVPLIVGRPRSVETVRRARREGDVLLVVAQKDPMKEEPSAQDLYDIGTICLISKLSQGESESFQLIANGLFRFRVGEYVFEEDFLGAKGHQLAEAIPLRSTRVETLAGEIRQLARHILGLASIPGSEALVKLFAQIDDPGQISDLSCTFLNLSVPAKQELLETLELEHRLERLLEYMVKEKEKLSLQTEIQSKMMERLSKDQRDHLLREQLKTIHEELGDEGNIQTEYARKFEEAGLSTEATKAAKDELARLLVVQRSSPEYHVIRTYLDWLVALPWKKEGAADSPLDLALARKILDEDHFGIEKVKKRILQFLAVTKLKRDLRGPVLCLVGPPGVGKTSVARSIARALGRSFVRTSLGGVRDEAEIRGHRRTYIGSMPGRVMQNLKRCGVRDPLMLLDEVDKLGMDFRGDPASALLELLDPEQNHGFLDHYIDVPFDLSRVFFVTTANMLDAIPPALRDRLEVIEMTGYTNAEKVQIAARHLIPKLVADHGIRPEQIEIPISTVELLIDGYTREAGVRNLSRELSQLMRTAAEELATEPPAEKVFLPPEKLDAILGPRRFHQEKLDEKRRPGIVTGLAWTPVGGEILNVEATKMEGKGHLTLTGSLGDVMKESAQLALSLVRSRWGRHFPVRFEKTDFHVHVPGGAVPKDGPSAGVAMFVAMASLLENKAVDPRLAVTGEITLRGQVLPVGGIKEKVLAAHRAGITTVCLPKRNEADLREVPAEVRSTLQFRFVDDVQEALVLAGLGADFLKSTVDKSHVMTN